MYSSGHLHVSTPIAGLCFDPDKKIPVSIDTLERTSAEKSGQAVPRTKMWVMLSKVVIIIPRVAGSPPNLQLASVNSTENVTLDSVLMISGCQRSNQSLKKIYDEEDINKLTPK